MQGVLSKAEESLRTKDAEIGRLKRKVLCTLFLINRIIIFVSHNI